MIKSSMGAACATVLVALAGGLATPTASHAAIYGGVFDPSNNFYQWSGNHVFTVADACLTGTGWRSVNNLAYGCGSAGLVSGDLTVVNKLNTPNLLDDVSRTLQFGNILGSAISGNNPLQPFVWGIYVENGELRGIDTLETSFFQFAAVDGLTHGGNWSLQWTSGRATSGYCTLFPNASFCPVVVGRPDLAEGSAALNALPPDPAASVLLRNFITGAGANENLPRSSDSVTFQRIPEPTTVTLVLAALGAGWLARRRRR